MTDPTIRRKSSQRRQVIPTNVGLYQEDLETLRWLQQRYDADSASQTVRRALKDARRMTELLQEREGVAA